MRVYGREVPVRNGPSSSMDKSNDVTRACVEAAHELWRWPGRCCSSLPPGPGTSPRSRSRSSRCAAVLCDRIGDAGRGGCLAAAAPVIEAEAHCVKGCGDDDTESMRASKDKASISASCGWTGGGRAPVPTR